MCTANEEVKQQIPPTMAEAACHTSLWCIFVTRMYGKLNCNTVIPVCLNQLLWESVVQSLQHIRAHTRPCATCNAVAQHKALQTVTVSSFAICSKKNKAAVRQALFNNREISTVSSAKPQVLLFVIHCLLLQYSAI